MSLPLEKQTSFTYQDYLKIDDCKRYEVIDGELYIVPAPNTRHQNISGNLYGLINVF